MKAKTTVFLWVLSLVVTIVALCISEWLVFFPLVAFGYISNYMNKISESVGLLYQLWNLNKDKWEDSEFKDLFIKMKKYVE